MWVTVSAGGCEISSSAACITDGPGSYSNNERCTFAALSDIVVTATGTFATESGYDYLQIESTGSTRYQGSKSNDPVILAHALSCP